VNAVIIFGFQNCWKFLDFAEQVLASQEGFRPMECVSRLINWVSLLLLLWLLLLLLLLCLLMLH
jgi:hypothetical protein